jgi:transposase
MELEESVVEPDLLVRIAAIDIAKASSMVCLRVPHLARPGVREQRVWSVGATTSAILELGDLLLEAGVQRVVMEATGTYWKPYFFLLESVGLECWLVNARDVKNVPGRPKTDRLDSIWLAKLAERGMLRPSFVPARPVRELRDLTRLRTCLTQERTRHKQRVEKVLEDAHIKLSSVATDIFGTSGRAMLDALVAGRRQAVELADLAVGKLKAKRAALIEALNGQFNDHHSYMVSLLLADIDHLKRQIDQLTLQISAALALLEDRDEPAHTQEPSTRRHALERLDEIPGVGLATAQVILAEVGLDMSIFPTAGHLASWAKLTPRTIQSGGKNTSGPTGQGNPWLKRALGEAASSAARTDTFLGARYKRLVRRRGHAKALVAIARNILEIVWHLLSDPGARFQDLGADYHLRLIDDKTRTRKLIRELEALGHSVALTPTPTTG